MSPNSKPGFWQQSVVVCLFVSHVALSCDLSAQAVAETRRGPSEPERKFVGDVKNVVDNGLPRPVRNDVAQAGDEIVTLRYWRIKKGSFDEFLKVSTTGVWPYFEKLGVRVIGMWQVIEPENVAGAIGTDEKDYDEVYLATRYSGVEHWKATRETVRHGGNGPDWQACDQALSARRKLTLSTYVTFLKGRLATNGPFFMPGLDEAYKPIR